MIDESRNLSLPLPLDSVEEEQGHSGGSIIIPPAFYRDDDPPDPPDDDPHWREFPSFNLETLKGTHLLIAGIVVGVTFATFFHLAILLFI